MTLKEYLGKHNVGATADDRSRIGMLLSKLEHNFCRVAEDGYNVKSYERGFFESNKVTELLINYFRS